MPAGDAVSEVCAHASTDGLELLVHELHFSDNHHTSVNLTQSFARLKHHLLAYGHNIFLSFHTDRYQSIELLPDLLLSC